MNQALFASIAKSDPLALFNGGKPNGAEITSFLHLRTKDVARATRLSENSIRYDLRIPEFLQAWLRDVATTVSLVAEFFGGDPEKTSLWFSTPNPLLGSIPPIDMIKM